MTTGWAKARSSEPNLADFPLPHKLVCSLLLLNLEIALLGCKITAEAASSFIRQVLGAASPELHHVRRDGLQGATLPGFALAALSCPGWRRVKCCLAGACH